MIAFKGLMIEWVVVKAHAESNDLWSESRYKVFRKVTENCHAAMCHFYSPTMPELAVRSFMVKVANCFCFLFSVFFFYFSIGFIVTIHCLVVLVKGVVTICIFNYHQHGGIFALWNLTMRSASDKRLNHVCVNKIFLFPKN